MMTEISTIDGGQKDALLSRANIKKEFFTTIVLLKREACSEYQLIGLISKRQQKSWLLGDIL